MENGNISNVTMPTIALSVGAFLTPKPRKYVGSLVDKLPYWAFNKLMDFAGSAVSKAVVAHEARMEGAPIIKAMEERGLFRVALIDVVPAYMHAVIKADMRKYFPSVEVVLVDNIGDLRYELIRNNIDTYYTTNQHVFSQVRFNVKTMFFVSWTEI